MPRGRPKKASSRSKTAVKRKIDPAVSVWEHLRRLLAKELYEDAILLFEVTNFCSNRSNIEVPTRLDDIATYADVARAYYETERYPPSEQLFKNVLSFLPFPERKPNDDPDLDFSVDAVRYQFYECLMKMRKYIDAYTVLTEIESEESKEKVKQAMQEVVQLAQTKRPQDPVPRGPWKNATFTEEGYRECESSIGSVAHILRNGLKTTEKHSNLPMAFVESFAGPEKHDIEMWLKAQEMISQYEFQKGVDFLKRMSHRNSRVQWELGKLMYKIGRKEETRRLLQIAFDIDNCWIDGMDLLAFLYSSDESKYGSLLERLTTKLLQLWPDRPETHCAAGFMARYLDYQTAFSYGIRAIEHSIRGTEQYVYACLLKSSCMSEFGNQPDAMHLLKDALEHDPSNTELNLALVDLLLEHDEYREAKNLVNSLVYNNPRDVHAKLLKVHVFINVNNRNRDMTLSAVSDLIRVLDEVLTWHPHVIGSVTTLMKEFYKTNQTEKCSVILEGIAKYKHYLPHSKQVTYHRLNSDYDLKFQKPVHAYSHMVAAMGLGSEVSPGYMADMEFELRSHGQIELDRQFPFVNHNDSSSDCSTIRGSPPPSTSQKSFKKLTPTPPQRSRVESSPVPSTSRNPPPIVFRPPTPAAFSSWTPSTSSSIPSTSSWNPSTSSSIPSTSSSVPSTSSVLSPRLRDRLPIRTPHVSPNVDPGDGTPPNQDENIGVNLEYSDGDDDDDDDDDDDSSSSDSSEDDIRGRMGFGRGYDDHDDPPLRQQNLRNG